VPLDGTTWASYAPLSAGVALHRQLAESGVDPDGWLAFANRYGRLGLKSVPDCAIEFQSDWRTTVVWLREAIRVWDLSQVKDEVGLAEVIRWEGEGVVHYRPSRVLLKEIELDTWKETPDTKGQDIIGNAPGAADLRRRIRQGDLIRPAILFVHQLIHGPLWAEVGPQLVWDGKRNRTVRQDRPRSLLGAVYLGFAQEVLHLRKPGNCRVCGRWFELSPVPGRSHRQTRADRTTCSTACRSKAYRERQEEARRLFGAGKTVKEIAKQLDCQTRSVKGWVKGVQQGE
jgi:hypothetical protein